MFRRRNLFVLLAVVAVSYAGFRIACWSIHANVGPIAPCMVEIGNTLSPKQVTAHKLFSKWHEVHGAEVPSDGSQLRSIVVSCVKDELPKKFWYPWLPAEEQASLQEAIVQLNMEGKPKINIPSIELPTSLTSLFSSKK